MGAFAMCAPFVFGAICLYLGAKTLNNMGLDYGITLYIKSSKVPDCLTWLYNNTDPDRETININFQGKNLLIRGSNPKIGNNTPETFEGLSFSTSLLFDIDLKTIGTIAAYDIEYHMESLKYFKTCFESAYQGNGKISIGNFDGWFWKLDNHDAYELTLTAVTSDMSLMVQQSLAVKKWALEISEASEALLTFFELESDGHRIIYYEGQQVDITIHDALDIPKPLLDKILPDYLKYITDATDTA